MSIHKLRSSFDRKGCQVALWVIMVGAAVALAGSGFLACFSKNQGQYFDPSTEQEVMVVNGTSVSMFDVNLQRELLADNIQDFTKPDAEFWQMSDVIVSLVTDKVVENLANKYGVMVNDATVLSLMSQQIDSDILQFRQNAVLEQNLPQDAVESEFQAYFEKVQGVTTREYKDNQVARVQELLDDEHRRHTVLINYARSALEQWYLVNTVVTDEEIVENYEQYEILSIMFFDLEATFEERETLSKAAYAELEAGADFIEVMNKYASSPSIDPITVNRADVEQDPSMQGLKDIEVGGYTEISYGFVGIPVIHKLVSISSELPEDFEDTKLSYKNRLQQARGREAYITAMRDGIKNATIKWSSPGYKTVFELTIAISESTSDMEEAELKTFLENVVVTSLEDSTDPAGSRAAIYARYVAMEHLDKEIYTIIERNDNAETRVEVLSDVTDIDPSVRVRLDLVELHERMEQMDKAIFRLKDAADTNRGFDEINTQNFEEIERTLNRYKTDEKIDEVSAAEILALLNKWSADKLDVATRLQEQQADLDRFTINPATGKTLRQEAEEREAAEAVEAAKGTEGEEGETDEGAEGEGSEEAGDGEGE